jgi:hypothetical protein
MLGIVGGVKNAPRSIFNFTPQLMVIYGRIILPVGAERTLAPAYFVYLSVDFRRPRITYCVEEGRSLQEVLQFLPGEARGIGPGHPSSFLRFGRREQKVPGCFPCVDGAVIKQQYKKYTALVVCEVVGSVKDGTGANHEDSGRDTPAWKPVVCTSPTSGEQEPALP